LLLLVFVHLFGFFEGYGGNWEGVVCFLRQGLVCVCVCMCLGGEWDTGRLKAELKQPGLRPFSICITAHFPHLVPQTFHLPGALPVLTHQSKLVATSPVIYQEGGGTKNKKQSRRAGWASTVRTYSQGFLHIQIIALS